MARGKPFPKGNIPHNFKGGPDRDLMHAREKKWRQSANGKEKRSAAQKKRRNANPQTQRDWRLRKYGVTQATYEKMVAAQGNVCAICFRDGESCQWKKTSY